MTEIERLQQENDELRLQVADLTERLRESMRMNSISQNQELLALKENIHKRLKLDYKEYLMEQNAPCNEDEFAANIATLGRVFRTLKALGVSFDY